MKKIFIFIILITFSPKFAMAYLGPGTAFGVILGSIGVLVAIIVFLFGIVWFPLRRLLKRNKIKENKKNKIDN